jgi:hypothetical protein
MMETLPWGVRRFGTMSKRMMWKVMIVGFLMVVGIIILYTTKDEVVPNTAKVETVIKPTPKPVDSETYKNEELIRIVKEAMHKPESFEYLATSYMGRGGGDWYRIIMRFWGENMRGERLVIAVEARPFIGNQNKGVAETVRMIKSSSPTNRESVFRKETWEDLGIDILEIESHKSTESTDTRPSNPERNEELISMIKDAMYKPESFRYERTTHYGVSDDGSWYQIRMRFYGENLIGQSILIEVEAFPYTNGSGFYGYPKADVFQTLHPKNPKYVFRPETWNSLGIRP